MEDQNLPIAIRSRANPNRRNPDLRRDPRRDFPRHALQHQHHCACGLQRVRIVQQLVDRGGRFPLHLVSAHPMHRLRREPQMPDYWNFRRSQPFHQLSPACAAFNLDCLRASFLHKAHCVGDRVICAQVVRTPWHIRRDNCPTHRSTHCARMVQHLVDRHRQRCVVAHHHHGERVADEDQVDPSLVDEPCRCVVVGGQRGNRPARLLLFLDCLEGHWNRRGCRLIVAELREAHVVSSAASPSY